MKKLLLLILVILLAVFISGKFSNKSDSPVTEPETELVTETVSDNIGRTKEWIDAKSFDRYELIRGFLENNPGVTLTKPDSQGDSSAYIVEDIIDMVVHSSGKATVYTEYSVGYPFAVICSEMAVNPFYNFSVLKNDYNLQDETFNYKSSLEEGVEFDSEYLTDTSGKFEFNAPSFSLKKKEYPFTEYGCTDFLKNVVSLMKTNTGNLNNLTVYGNLPTIYYSHEDECYYCFVIKYDTSYAYINALYFRSDEGEKIDNVTAQSMFIEYPVSDFAAGASISLAYNDIAADFEVITMVAAIEQVLTGTSYLEGRRDIPSDFFGQRFFIEGNYELEGFDVGFDQKYYRRDVRYTDLFVVYTYSIKK